MKNPPNPRRNMADHGGLWRIIEKLLENHFLSPPENYFSIILVGRQKLADSGGLYFWRTVADFVFNNATGGLGPRRTLSAANNGRRGKKSAANIGGLCPRRKTLADFLAERPPSCGGSAFRGGYDPLESAKVHRKVRQCPPKTF